MSEALEVAIARFGFDLLRELGFRHEPHTDCYAYDGPRVRTREEVIRAFERAR